MKLVDIIIDKLTNSILNRITGDVFDTNVLRINSKEGLKKLKDWSFDWIFEQRNAEVYKLTITGNENIIQGLISLEDKGNSIFINLIENAPFNIGKNKTYDGVAGNLFAFACKLSLDKGYNGFVSFIAKTNLIVHYKEFLGARQIGNSGLMIINEKEAKTLINKYFK